MAITIDTHVLIWYIDKSLNKRLSGNAMAAIVEAEQNDIVYVPIIVLMEVLHLAERKKVSISFNDLINRIENSSNYVIIPFDITLLKIAEPLKGLEAHDRLILATALLTETPLITKDIELRKNGANVIW